MIAKRATIRIRRRITRIGWPFKDGPNIWHILHPYHNDAVGFAATLFERNGEKVMTPLKPATAGFIVSTSKIRPRSARV